MLKKNYSAEKKPKRIIVLGCGGFIGSSILNEAKKKSIEVLGITSKEIDLTSVNSVEALQKVVKSDDTLIIVSALTPDKGKDVKTLMLNLNMGQNLNSFLKNPVCNHIVYISSDAVYADDAHPVRETSACDPSSYHGLMHLARERMLAESAKMSKTPLLIIRPCAVYGKGDTHLSYGPNKFVKTAKEEGAISFFGKGEEKKDHIYIDDLSKLTLKCVLHKVEGTLNAASGNSISFHDIADIISCAIGKQLDYKYSSRQNPITHRHFDMSQLLALFPDFPFTPHYAGISHTLGDKK